MLQTQKQTGMTTIRISDEFRARLGRIRARITLKEGKELNMEELLERMADLYEEHEHEGKSKK